VPNEDARAAVQAVAHLLQGMLAADGITVLRSDGRIAGYNAFVHHLPGPTLENSNHQIGGARQRTFAALSARVGQTLVAAFFYSQDGYADCRWVGDQRQAVMSPTDAASPLSRPMPNLQPRLLNRCAVSARACKGRRQPARGCAWAAVLELARFWLS